MKRLTTLAALAVAAAAAYGGVPDATPAFAAPPPTLAEPPVRSGDIVIVTPNNSQDVLTSGGSATRFSLRLPEGAMCPGDSRFDQYRTQSFIVPEGVDIATLEFDVNDPVGENNWSLYMTDTRPYVDEILLPNEAPGQPAIIPVVPPLTFEAFPVGLLPDGVYTVGLACTYFRDTSNWWDTRIRITADSSDQPGQMRWEVLGSSGEVDASASPSGEDASASPSGDDFSADTDDDNSLGLILGVAAALALVGLGVVLVRRRAPSARERIPSMRPPGSSARQRTPSARQRHR